MKDTFILIEHILNSIDKIDEFLANTNEDEFNKNIQLQDAIIRRLEIISRAAKDISIEFKNNHKDIQWKEISDLRSAIIDNYLGLSLELLWAIVKKDLPDLRIKLERII